MSPSHISLADVEKAFSSYDFSGVDSPSIEPRTLIWMEVNRIGSLLAEDSPEAAANVETLCAQLEYIGLKPPSIDLLAYVDIAPQSGILKNLLPLWASTGAIPESISFLPVLEQWKSSRLESRLFSYLLAERQLEAGLVAEALTNVRASLNLNNVCVSSQRLLETIARRHPEAFSPPSPLSDVQEYLKGKFCPHPFEYISSSWQGKTFGCRCPAWVPFETGNLLDDQATEVWNSPTSIEIRKSILDGSFKYCSRTLCSLIKNRALRPKSSFSDSPLWKQIESNNPRIETPPRFVELNHDYSCNLACPSCRTEIRVAKAADSSRFSQAVDRNILPLLRQVNGLVYITGGGEPFASKHYREILSRLNPLEYPNLGLILMSNAQLINEETWQDFAHLQPLLRSVSISIDAASAATYEKVRRPGKWEKLLEGMAFLSRLRAQNAIPFLQINFVVQSENLPEVLDFIALGEQWGVDLIWLQRMSNYGSFTTEAFYDQNLCHPDHPDHARLLETLQDPKLDTPLVDFHMFHYLVSPRHRFPSKFPYFDPLQPQTEKLH